MFWTAICKIDGRPLCNNEYHCQCASMLVKNLRISAQFAKNDTTLTMSRPHVFRSGNYNAQKSAGTCQITITSAWAVDREFVNIYIGPIWVPISPKWGQIGAGLDQIGSPFGLHLDPMGSHWPPWDPLGAGPVWGPFWEPRELSSAMPAHKICVFGIHHRNHRRD